MRIVIKIGTSLLNDSKNQLDRGFLLNTVGQIAALHGAGHQICIVSSGAVAAGRTELEFEREKKNIPYRQALAAVGQGILLRTYEELFKKHGITVAQALLTNFDFTNRENFLNTKNVFEILLQKNVIPIVNENDVTTIAELKFGDNDMLCAKTAAMISADLLVILTDVDGLFHEDPQKNPHAKRIPLVAKIDKSIHALASGARSASSLGGMVTKLEAAEYVTSVGVPMFIVNGREKNVLEKVAAVYGRVAAGHGSSGSVGTDFEKHASVGTFFPSQVSRMVSQKKWLKPKIQKNAWIEIDSGAVKALTEMGKSLLPSGIVKVHGAFRRGDVIVFREGAKEIGYGQVNYNAIDIDKIKKCHSGDIEKILGFSFEDEVSHRDRMVIVG